MKVIQKLIIISFIIYAGYNQATAQEQPTRLKVLCYNLRFGELVSLDQLAEFIKSKNPDIVALQEVDVRTQRTRAPQQNGKDFITELGFKTGMLTAYAKTIPYAQGYYGIGILSKYPMAAIRKVMLPMPDGAKEQRALLMADVELDNGKMFSFICTHLDYPSSAVRIAQVNALNEALKNNPYPMLIAGDFNAEPTSEEIKTGMAKWIQACTPGFTIPAKSPNKKIDYIFYYPADKWGKIAAETYQIQLSDHLPLSSELELK